MDEKRMRELADMPEEDRYKALEAENPEIAKIFREKKPQRQIVIEVREGETPMFTVKSDSHPDVVFIDLIVAIGDYIGRTAESLSQLKLMMNSLRDAATETASQRFMSKDPKKAMIEVLLENAPDALKELLKGVIPEEGQTAKCAECSKPCPLAGKRMENAPVSNDVICVHRHGPEGLQ